MASVKKGVKRPLEPTRAVVAATPWKNAKRERVEKSEDTETAVQSPAKPEGKAETKTAARTGERKRGQKILYCVYQLDRPPDWEKHQKALTLIPRDPQQFGRENQRSLWWKQESQKIPLFGCKNNRVCVPPQYGLKHFGPPDVDRRLVGQDIALTFIKRLWGPHDPFDQGPVIEALIHWIATHDSGGVIELPTSAGKTIIILYLIVCVLKKKALVVQPSVTLVNQFCDRVAENVPNARIGIIHRKQRKIKDCDIIVAMLHSLVQAFHAPEPDIESSCLQPKTGGTKGKKNATSTTTARSTTKKEGKDAKEGKEGKDGKEKKKEKKKSKPKALPPLKPSDFDDVGVVIYDEIHLFCTRTFKDAIVFLAHIRRMFGFSATVKRPNGMDEMLEPYLGPPVFSAPAAVKGAEQIEVQRIQFKEGEQKIILNTDTQEYDYVNMVQELHTDMGRIGCILHLIDHIMNVGRRLLLFVLYTDFGEYLYRVCKERHPKKRCINYTTKLTAADRSRVDSTPHDLIVATYAIFGFGVDATYLDTILFASPRKEVKQPVGRLRLFSKFERQSLLIIDFIDWFSVFRTQAGHRLQVYKEKGFTCRSPVFAGDVSFLYPAEESAPLPIKEGEEDTAEVVPAADPDAL